MIISRLFNLDFLKPFALPLAILLFTAEFIAGFSVLTGYRQKTGIWGVMILMLIFTPLTLILAITNPVSDCGCFGDAIHLTNWQTFGKNVVLLILVLILFTGRKKISRSDPLKGMDDYNFSSNCSFCCLFTLESQIFTAV